MSFLNSCGHFFLSFSDMKVAVLTKRTTSPEPVVNDPLISFYSCLTCLVISNSCRQNNQPTKSLKKFLTFLWFCSTNGNPWEHLFRAVTLQYLNVPFCDCSIPQYLRVSHTPKTKKLQSLHHQVVVWFRVSRLKLEPESARNDELQTRSPTNYLYVL